MAYENSTAWSTAALITTNRPDRTSLNAICGQIAPLLAARSVFAEVENFRLYDLQTASGEAHGDVIAYSNGEPERGVLVLFNNSDHRATGWLKRSAPFRRQADSAAGDPTHHRDSSGAGH